MVEGIGEKQREMVTIEEVYSKLIQEGINRKYEVIPEFSVSVLSTGTAKKTYNIKKIDLVWVKRRAPIDETKVGSLRHWKIFAAFEIEGYNVPEQRIAMHRDQFKRLGTECHEDVPSFVVLYTLAHHRNAPNWGNGDLKRETKLKSRIIAGGNDPHFKVVDGKKLNVLLNSIAK